MFKIIDEMRNSKQDRGMPDDCAEIHAVFYYFILLTSECQETVAKVVSVSYKYMFICYLFV